MARYRLVWLGIPGIIVLGWLASAVVAAESKSVDTSSTAGVSAGAAEIREELVLLAALYREPGMLGVALQRLDGAALLIGGVPDVATRSKAEKIARETLASAELRNRLRVEPAALHDATAFRDPVIRVRIEQALRADPKLTETRRHLMVSVKRRHGALEGQLNGPEQALLMIDKVRTVPGLVTLRFDGLRY